ncbi:MAG: LamG domain-containing protein, partial [Candidatus Hydrogenedentota bacterium]
SGKTPGAVQNAVYGFLEMLGFGFYTSQETAPNRFSDIPSLELPPFNESITPVFAVRGALPRYDYFMGRATWELEDYKAYIDALVRMRMNMVTFYVRDDQPFGAYEFNGELSGGEPLASMASGRWEVAPMPSDEFFAGTGRFYARETFGASAAFVSERRPAIEEAKAVLREAVHYAKGRGLQVGLGFEVKGDIFDSEVRERFEVRLRSILAEYPHIDCLWLWEPEGKGLYPGEDPEARSAWDSYTNRWNSAFEDVPDARRRAEATRMVLFAMHAKQVLDALRPDVRLVVSGWGGDSWLRCTDLYPGMDTLLPKDIVLSALDNLWVTPNISSAYNNVSADRECWPVIWHEFDGDLWMPQPNLYETAGACRDARSKGCAGLIGTHWRTRSVEEAMTYMARFAWNPELTVEAFIERRAADLFGPKVGATLAPALLRLQGLGYRYVGGEGQNEGVPFRWSVGDEEKRAELAQIALEVRDALGEDRTGLRSALKEITDLVPVPEAAKEILPTLTLGVGDALKEVLTGGTIRPDRMTRLRAGLSLIASVLAYDHAAGVLGPDGEFAKNLTDRDIEAALLSLEESKFAEAMYAYSRWTTTKGQLGVFASMNGRAWADIRNRLDLPSEELMSFTEAPETLTMEPRILVLADRVIVLGLEAEEIKVEVRARQLGASSWEKRELYQMGNQTFALAFPEEASEWPNFEWGVEVSSRFRTRLVAPATFPQHTYSSTNALMTDMSEVPAPPEREIKAPKVTSEIDANSYSVKLSWDQKPGEIYTVEGRGALLGLTPDAWYEDTAPPTGQRVRYSVTARNLLTGHTAERVVRVDVPELPLPQPPKEITALTRNSRVVLGWEASAPQATLYRVTKYDQDDNVVKSKDIAAEYGHYLQYADAAAAGEIFTYEIAAVAPDGKVGPASRRIGVVPAETPLKPMLDLSFDDEAFLAGMAEVAENALALGGSGWAELAPQPEWNPEEQLTISMWVKLRDLKGMPVLICKGTWQQSGYFLQIFREQVRFYIAGVGTLDAGHPKAGEWQHLAATYGNGEMHVYIDGELVGRKRVAGRPRPSAEAVLVGRYGLSDDVYFVRGLMDDIRIYRACLAPEEIEAIYRESNPE